MVAARYGGRPSDYLFDKRPDAWVRLQVDIAVALRAKLREGQPYREAEAERKAREAEGGSDGQRNTRYDRTPTNVISVVGGRISGSFGGKVLDENDTVLENYLIAQAKERGVPVMVAGELHSPDEHNGH